jgi:hypothetical protein
MHGPCANWLLNVMRVLLSLKGHLEEAQPRTRQACRVSIVRSKTSVCCDLSPEGDLVSHLLPHVLRGAQKALEKIARHAHVTHPHYLDFWCCDLY